MIGRGARRQFGGAPKTPEELLPAEVIQQDPRPLVDQVTSARLERAPGGYILRATGLPPRQGYWSADLVRRGRDGSALVYEFRAAPPFQSTPVSSERSRQIVAATFLSDQDLAGTREVRVLGARSSRSARR